MMETIAPEIVIAGALSVVMEWIPGAKAWWTTLASARKAQLMAAMVAAVTVGMALLRCYAYDGVCPADWRKFWWDVAGVFLLALAANQGFYQVAKAQRPGA